MKNKELFYAALGLLVGGAVVYAIVKPATAVAGAPPVAPPIAPPVAPPGPSAPPLPQTPVPAPLPTHQTPASSANAVRVLLTGSKTPTTETIPVGALVTIDNGGGTWNPVTSTVPGLTQPTANPVTFAYTGPGQAQFHWLDTSNVPQAQIVNFVNA